MVQVCHQCEALGKENPLVGWKLTVGINQYILWKRKKAPFSSFLYLTVHQKGVSLYNPLVRKYVIK